MNRRIELARRLVAAALVASALAYALLVVHNFYRYVDHAIYLATDDGLANISYAWANVGRYGFLSSPQLADVARTHGQFNYGPWYFGLGAGLIWLFGYSLTLLRSIHLWVIVGIAVLALRWFRDGRLSPAWSIVATGVLSWFVATHWPMVRPDSIVSLFAVLTIIAAGRAIDRRSRLAWAAAGLFAACGAFSHLIAWSLVPAVLVMWALSEGASMIASRARSDVEPAVAGLVGLGAGLAFGALMFYASFDFQIRTQLGFLEHYRQVTQAMMQNGGASTSFATLVAGHFHAAFGHLRPALQRLLVIALAAGWVIVAAALRSRSDIRRLVLVFCMPPLVAWTLYSLSLGTYANFHSGYKVLTQVVALWYLASLLFVFLAVTRDRSPAFAPVLGLVAALGCFYWSAITLRHSVKETDSRLLRTHEWVGVSTYVDEILSHVPSGATAWGTLAYGIENPNRVQLIQYGDAAQLLGGASREERRRLAPQYVLWGYQENTAAVTDVLRGSQSWRQQLERMLPDASYELTAIVVAPPYGATRVYEQLRHDDASRVPLVSVFDPMTQQWTRRADRVEARSEPSAPISLRLSWGGQAFAGTTTSARTLTLGAAGDYLLIARVRPGAASKGGVVIASPFTELEPELTEFGGTADFVSYRSNDETAAIIVRHGGGPVHVGVIDGDASTTLVDVDVYRMNPSPPSGVGAPAFKPIAEWSSWTTLRDVQAVDGPDGLAVQGNDSRFEYQLLSPELRTSAGARVRLRIGLRIEQGRVCVGVLNHTQQRFLVTPDQARSEYEFLADDSGGIRVVFANCGPANGAVVPSRFVVSSAEYAVVKRALYADEMVDAYERSRRRQ